MTQRWPQDSACANQYTPISYRFKTYKHEENTGNLIRTVGLQIILFVKLTLKRANNGYQYSNLSKVFNNTDNKYHLLFFKKR